MLARGSLDFYPPRSAGDFFDYFWAESIPPGVAALHAWAFACAGGAKAAWTIPASLLQLVALHEIIWRTAQHFGHERAARCACLAAAACPLLTWAVLLGQETGLTALALAGLAWALIAWRNNHSGGWAALAGVFAVLGASARDYGLVFPVLAAAGWLAFRADRRTWLEFALVAGLALVWPLRTWLLTGNPFHSLAVGGVFPVNERFVAWAEAEAATLGLGWAEAGRYLLLLAPAAVFGWGWLVVTALRRGRAAWWGLAAVAVVLALWAGTVRSTNGGLFYTLHVAAPALAIGCIAAGEALAATAWARGRLTWLAPALLGALLLANLRPTLALPLNHVRTPWREWPTFAASPAWATGLDDETMAIVARARATLPAGESASVLADAPGFQRRLAPLGIDVLPLWSPHVDWLFDRSLSGEALVRAWRESGVRFVIVSKGQPNLDFFNRRSRWQDAPLRADFVGETPRAAVFALRARE
ncbi:MAG: glycosyltransferase family 39 protein [Opitutaceae bacterium]|nr:glycosyltransferase family 39 protein [Opitutaceae bacterium]